MITITCTRESPWSPDRVPEDQRYMVLHPFAETVTDPENGLERFCPICGQEWAKQGAIHHKP